MVGVTKTKMTTGVLIYAFNNSRVDYWKQSVWCADRVTKFLRQPVTIVTNRESQKDRFCSHHIIYTEPESGGLRIYNPSSNSDPSSWFNRNRYQSYDISPYEKTIVLDSDYVVCSDLLNVLFRTNIPVTSVKNVYDITNRDSFRNYKSVRTDGLGLHHWWATVLYFDRSETSKHFFKIMSMVEKNYSHYANLYRFPASPFRNDSAVSIALTAIYGHLPNAVPAIPWKMANVGDDVEITQLDDDAFEFCYRSYKDEIYKKLKLQGQDFHFMNKKSLAHLYEN